MSSAYRPTGQRTISDRIAGLALGAYRLMGASIYPFMGPFLRYRAKHGKEDRARRYERYGYPSVERPAGPVVWFHAASVGECLAILPLIERIDGQDVHVILTTGTVTSAEIMRSRLPSRAFHQYVPLDLPKAVRRFLDHWKPDLAIFAESEIWPTTIMEMGSRKVPMVLVNARMSDRSFKRWSAAPALADALFSRLSHVIAQSELDAERFRDLGASPISVSGNLKVDTSSLPYDDKELARFRAQIGNRPVWIAASTHPGEEEIALRTHRVLAERIPDLLTLVVPRHPDRADEVASVAVNMGLGVARRGAGQPIRPQTAIFLGDTIGEMGLYLRLAQVAFMGRSLAGTGGQNPLEPAMTGAAILSGRNVQNFRDAYRNLLNAGAARLVRDEEMLAANVEYLLLNPDERRKMTEAARRTVASMRGALQRTMNTLDAYVFPLTVKRDLESL